MKFQIKSRFDARVLFEGEFGSLKLTLEAAVKAGANLARANLAYADLARADLAGANLADAYLARANLAGANLAGAYLAGANLADANLADADLAGANLADANLADADLAGAYLAGANLADANLAGANLAGANLADANLADADLAGANLADAYLARADLAGANLARANLAYADLAGAYLAGANLAGANLARANLARAKGVKPELSTDLIMLLDQPGKIRAYKLVNENGEGPINGGLKYEIGKPASVDNADTNPETQCGAGVNVATLPWCLREWRPGYRVLVVEFEAKDIAAIPHGTDGKFRLHRCDVIAEKVLDYAALGLVKP